MNSEKVKLKLINGDLNKVVISYSEKYNKMKDIVTLYIQIFKDNGYDNVSAAYKRNYIEGYTEIVGFRNYCNDLSSKFKYEMFSPHLNTFKRRESYQPLKKSKFNKEFTNNFEDLKVSYLPIIEVIFGNRETTFFDDVKAELVVKSFEFYIEDNSLIIVIDRKYINQHILDNFIEYEDK